MSFSHGDFTSTVIKKCVLFSDVMASFFFVMIKRLSSVQCIWKESIQSFSIIIHLIVFSWRQYQTLQENKIVYRYNNNRWALFNNIYEYNMKQHFPVRYYRIFHINENYFISSLDVCNFSPYHIMENILSFKKKRIGKAVFKFILWKFI